MPEAIERADLEDALADCELRFAAANPNSERRHHDSMSALPGGNTRTGLHYSPFPIAFESGEAQHLTDFDGHVYTDFLGDYSAGLYGHSNPTIMAAARNALDRGLVFGGPNEHEADFARLLKARFPSVDLLRFTNSGTEANLMAMVTAREVTRRDHIFVFSGGYHGSVLNFRGDGPLNVPFPYIVGTFNDAEGSYDAIERNKHKIAAVIVEPMLGGSGAIPGSTDFLSALRDVTTKHGIALIFDEVMTSRLAPGGIQEIVGIVPDMTTFGKYLGGGFAFGAFGGSLEFMERYDPVNRRRLDHPGTFNNNTMTMAAGAAGLREVFTPNVAVSHNLRGDALRNDLNALFGKRDVAMQATGIGSLLNIHFQRGVITDVSDVVPQDPKRALFQLAMMEHGYYVSRRGYLSLSLPLQQSDLDGFVGAVGELIDQYWPLLH
ncbi:aminotransferase class III-fold pyridoxal phosphate-dependent enzyme [Rhodococcus sp. KBS0724]|uniref:aspartate aminotransferase family protein n=1 Tax=Rhodococcus sp. KBS0724 TaxID=1179674 RepID=UPI00110F66F5|nr:aminotransferase class III-fold pyridoxal phosphate-dependent enzyme [Rhodococcus sp. KBS0724]TSD40314.1 aminotransferase class III-fold pyridoxal phosphate-dependent enzyme [Rhodococcus sp. KBS0724]